MFIVIFIILQRCFYLFFYWFKKKKIVQIKKYEFIHANPINFYLIGRSFILTILTYKTQKNFLQVERTL